MGSAPVEPDEEPYLSQLYDPILADKVVEPELAPVLAQISEDHAPLEDEDVEPELAPVLAQISEEAD